MVAVVDEGAMRVSGSTRARWCVVLACLCVALGLIAAAGVARVARASAPATSPVVATSPSATPTPTWKLRSFRSIGADRSFKAQLCDELPAAPELLVVGGSRATRFEPSELLRRTGLHAMNCSVQNCRPEDLFAFASYLYQRSPETKLRCFFAVQTTTFRDKQLNAGLLYDARLAQWFPPDLLAAQKASLGKPRKREVLGVNRFSARGLLLRNVYDVRRARPDYSLDRRLDGYIKAILPAATWRGHTAAPRSRAYFERAMKLFNDHDVVPVVVLMPYHPRALKAFRAVGFQRQVDELLGYFKRARTRCDFRVVNLIDIKSFGGDRRWFYDGAHVTRENARRIIRRTVALAPECLR
jgi:hypothetical protein